MSDNKFFSIDGLGCAAHTPKTLKIWTSWDGEKSTRGRQAIIKFAEFENMRKIKEDITQREKAIIALNYLEQYLLCSTRSNIMRHAIINYS